MIKLACIKRRKNKQTKEKERKRDDGFFPVVGLATKITIIIEF